MSEMTDTSFAHMLLLHGPERRGSLLSLLSEERRKEIEVVLERAGQLSRDQLYVDLQRLRHEQRSKQFEMAAQRYGTAFTHVAPKLATWLARPF